MYSLTKEDKIKYSKYVKELYSTTRTSCPIQQGFIQIKIVDSIRKEWQKRWILDSHGIDIDSSEMAKLLYEDISE